MKANYTVVEGDLRMIRPLVNIREKELREFANKNALPVINENCPACFEAPTERQRVKQLIASQELIVHDLVHSINRAIQPLLAINETGLENKNSIGDALTDVLTKASDADSSNNNRDSSGNSGSCGINDQDSCII